ncbi:MAG: hypothetical protein JSW61_05995 [Candidatus Thorarchaeota archaeon]|nr:MAG: hypothetical protein JSW61_05995 [Candidatus Thorarchaeota archaeon]
MGEVMTGKWYHVARVEFLVLTSRQRKRRRTLGGALLVLGTIWALIVAPFLASFVMDWFGATLEASLIASFPEYMRSLIMFLWLMWLVYPISYALQEIKIGQWEIMLSNNVRTRDIMTGTFMGRVPIYGLAVLFIAPCVISPFALVYQVTLVGQALMYLALFFVALITLWTSTLLTTAIQAKIGDSPRGNDIAKALSVILGFVAILPLYGMLFSTETISSVLGAQGAMLFPFTWGADLITWITILFNGINLPASSILAYESVLGSNPQLCTFLLSAFTLLMIGLAFLTSDRVFKLGFGPRYEQIVTTGRENPVLQGIRWVLPTPYGTLLVTAMKDFGRKAQNISKIAFGVVIAVVFPLMVNSAAFLDLSCELRLFVSGLAAVNLLSVIGGLTFGGIGFLDSKDQLWMLKSTPKGVMKYMKARIGQSFIFGFPMAAITALLITLIIGLPLADAFVILGCASIAVMGSILISIGVTANNPNYEDAGSQIFKDNTGATMLTIFLVSQPALLISMIIDSSNMALALLAPSIALIAVGLLIIRVGATRMAMSE